MPLNDSGDAATRRSFSRTYDDEERMALSAIDCALDGDKAVYASSELTSGRRINRTLAAEGKSTASELRRHLGEEQWRQRCFNPNVAAASAFARRVREQLGGKVLVITPGHFDAPGWEQDNYRRFWKALIQTRVGAVYFNDGWEYSTGCTFEFAAAVEYGVATFDAAGKPLSVEAGIDRIEVAVRDLERQGLDTRSLRDILAGIRPARPGLPVEKSATR